MNASALVPNALWEAIEPLLPKESAKPSGGSNRYSAGGAPLARERARRNSVHLVTRHHSIHHRPARATRSAPEASSQAACGFPIGIPLPGLCLDLLHVPR